MLLPARDDPRPTSPHDFVTLTVPALPEFVRSVRITSAALSSYAGLNFDEVDDVRLAVDELCMALMTEGRIGSLVIQFEVGHGEITISGRAAFTDARAAAPGGNRRRAAVLAATIAEHNISPDAHPPTFWARMRAAVSSDDRAAAPPAEWRPRAGGRTR